MFKKQEITDYGKREKTKKYCIGLVDTFSERQNLLRFLGEFSQERALDLGCGSGQFTEMMYQAGLNCIGADLSDKFVGIARRTYPHLRFFQQDASAMSFFKFSVPSVLCCR